MKNNYPNLSTNLSFAVVKIWRRMIHFLFVRFIFPCRQNHLTLEVSFFFYNVVVISEICPSSSLRVMV